MMGYFNIIFMIVVGVLVFMGMGYMHEMVHKTILLDYGIESEIQMFKSFPSFATIAEEPCPTDSCTLAHNINDAIGYHLLFILIIIWMVGFLIVVQGEFRNDSLENIEELLIENIK